MPADEEDEKKLFLRRKHHLTTCMDRALKRAHRRVADRQTILEQCQEWENVAHTAQLLQSNLFQITKGSPEIQVNDWLQEAMRTIPLDPRVDPAIQVATYFKQSRKLRLGEKYAEKQLKLMEEELAKNQKQEQELESILTMDELKNYCQRYHLHWQRIDTSIPLAAKEPPKPYRIYHSESGMEIWVGKSAKDNDRMTFECANGSDWWFHVADYPGSHVVLRCPKGKEPDRASVEQAAELALRFSKVKDHSSGDVTQTQVKWLKRIKSCPGKVMLSNAKRLHVKVKYNKT